MHIYLNELHSALRWLIIILLLATIIDSAVRMYRPFKENERKLALFALIALHTQALIGFALYFVSPMMRGFFAKGDIMKDAVSRFYVVEHLAGMLIAAVLVTLGYSRAKRQAQSWAKHRILFYYYLFAFLIILISIPWPFRQAGASLDWF